MTTRRLIAALLHLALPLFAGCALFAGGYSQVEAPAVGGWVAEGAIDREVANDTLSGKPVNEWGTKDLLEAGFEGCVKVEDPAHMKGIPTAHVVRLPVAEGWGWVKMDAAEVARRTEGFGGTPSTKDDVKIVGNCY